jgi:hydroxypyruvate reductase
MTAALLSSVFLEVAERLDGALLVEESLAESALTGAEGRLSVLAVGKVAFPMFAGLRRALGTARIGSGLIVAPHTVFPERPDLPPGVRALVSDHPDPSERSVAAGRAALSFVSSLTESDTLLVLVSGGGSAALVLPADDLTLDEKRKATKAVARAGASIAELNAVRKHLSAIKGGRLALATRARTLVLALSDVVGSDPGTIASGPFAADGTTFDQALALVERLAPQAPERVKAHLRRGAAGQIAETPKPGDPRLAHVEFRLLAGPERVVEEARLTFAKRNVQTAELSRNTEQNVTELAALYGGRARRETLTRGTRVLIGNGEPAIVVSGNGRGGRSTHLALLMARELAGLENVAFLAAGTDDRDGSGSASGAVVDGNTWKRAQDLGLDPEGALQRCDSETPLAALGALVQGPGTSNLLDLHLLSIG